MGGGKCVGAILGPASRLPDSIGRVSGIVASEILAAAQHNPQYFEVWRTIETKREDTRSRVRLKIVVENVSEMQRV